MAGLSQSMAQLGFENFLAQQITSSLMMGLGFPSNMAGFSPNAPSNSMNVPSNSVNGPSNSLSGVTTTVHSASDLLGALQNAHGGDTILLAPGTYSGVTIKNLNESGTVTIRSSDPAHQAVLTDLHVNNSSGLTFSHLEFSVGAGDPATFPVYIQTSQNLSFDHLSIHGTMDGNPANDHGGLRITGSTNVSVTNSEFQQLGNGLLESSNTGVTVSDNYFHDIRIDGVDNNASSNVTISDNYFSNFFHVGSVGSGGDHSDAIQFWTNGTTASVHDITVKDNLIVQGVGHDMQGIFLHDEVGTLPFQNVTITGNAIVGGNWNGIFVDDAQSLTITGNKVIGLTGQSQTPAIKVGGISISGGDISNNQATSLQISSATSTTQSNNTTLGASSDGGQSALHSWFVSHPDFLDAQPQGVTSALGALSILPGGGGAGSDNLHAGSGGDVVFGMGGDDRIWGGSGADHLSGGPGNDVIVGGAGNDTIEGGPGADAMDGESGADTFVYRDGDFAGGLAASEDTIYHFSSTEGDKIDLSRVDANTATPGADDHFTFIGTQDFHSTAGELRYVVGGGAATIYGDTNGDGVADFAIKLVGVSTLSSSDFVL
jgi:hypothetical protein